MTHEQVLDACSSDLRQGPDAAEAQHRLALHGPGDEMQRSPVPRDDRLLDGTMLLRVLLMASAAVLVTFGRCAWRIGQGVALEQVRTETFTLLAMCQWFNVLNCQSGTQSALRPGVLKNRWLLGGLVLSILLQPLVLYAAPLKPLFHTLPQSGQALLLLLLLTSTVLWVEEPRKWLVRRHLGRAS